MSTTVQGVLWSVYLLGVVAWAARQWWENQTTWYLGGPPSIFGAALFWPLWAVGFGVFFAIVGLRKLHAKFSPPSDTSCAEKTGVGE